MELKTGARLRSVTDTTEVVIVKAPGDDVDLRCGGHPMVPMNTDAPGGRTVESGFDEGTLVGKRYADEELGLEVLCTKAGPGSLSLGLDPLPVKGAKPLPSSD
jgi:hypothetical protein